MLALLWVAAVPLSSGASISRNESAAIATLKNISSAQAQMQAAAVIDLNDNGQGEYAFFAEMAGAIPPRGSSEPLRAPVLAAAFGAVDGGRVVHSGYVFQMCLPGEEMWIPEAAAGGVPRSGVDAALAEVLWCCYAWPLEPGVTGHRSFVITQSGDVLAANHLHGRVPTIGQSGFYEATLHSGCAANTVDARGDVWVVM